MIDAHERAMQLCAPIERTAALAYGELETISKAAPYGENVKKAAQKATLHSRVVAAQSLREHARGLQSLAKEVLRG